MSFVPLRQLIGPLIFLVFLLSDFPGAAQETPTDEGGGRLETPDEIATSSSSLKSLRALIDSIAAKDAELAELAPRLEADDNPALKDAAIVESKKFQEALDELQAQFDSIAGGVEVAEFTDEPPEPVDPQAELMELLKPLLDEAKKATAIPRELEALTQRLEVLDARRQRAAEAVRRTTTLLDAVENQNAPLPERLDAALRAWQNHQKEAENEITVTRHQLEKKELEQKPLLESTRETLLSFFRSRGMNLLLGFSAFALTYAAIRFLYKQVHRLLTRRRSFGSRLVDVIFQLLASIAALFSMVMVFHVAHDILLLALTILFFAGICWGGIRFLPGYMEQLRLLLNIGPVREGERVVMDGLPWRVNDLRFYSKLSNESLSGGNLRLPIKMLIGVHSRPCPENEAWFPCREGDWIQLENGQWGKILSQTPEVVTLEPLGKAIISYQTAAFLALNPQNLSHGFRVTTVFGIDYRHQPDATSKIPEAMKSHVESGLLKRVEPNQLLHLEVELKQAGASSLDYEVDADFSGDVAPLYEQLNRALTTLLVEASNQNGWSIPFNQLTIHQADPK
jgi:hypothetical protein